MTSQAGTEMHLSEAGYRLLQPGNQFLHLQSPKKLIQPTAGSWHAHVLVLLMSDSTMRNQFPGSLGDSRACLVCCKGLKKSQRLPAKDYSRTCIPAVAMAVRNNPQGCAQLVQSGLIPPSLLNCDTFAGKTDQKVLQGQGMWAWWELARGLGELSAWLGCAVFAVHQCVNVSFPFTQRRQ